MGVTDVPGNFGHNDMKNIGYTPEKLTWIGKGNSL